MPGTTRDWPSDIEYYIIKWPARPRLRAAAASRCDPDADRRPTRRGE